MNGADEQRLLLRVEQLCSDASYSENETNSFSWKSLQKYIFRLRTCSFRADLY